MVVSVLRMLGFVYLELQVEPSSNLNDPCGRVGQMRNIEFIA
jgi:hypothetical protein